MLGRNKLNGPQKKKGLQGDKENDLMLFLFIFDINFLYYYLIVYHWSV